MNAQRDFNLSWRVTNVSKHCAKIYQHIAHIVFNIQMSRKRIKNYLTNEEIDKVSITKHCHRINETSNYPLHLLFIDQQFSIKYVQIYLFIKEEHGVPYDLASYIFLWIYKEEMKIPFADDVDSAYNNYTSTLQNNLHLFMGFQPIGAPKRDRFENLWHNRENNAECTRCKYVTGSLHCSLHMACNLCGFNRRFEACAHDLLERKLNPVYKTNLSHLSMDKGDIVIKPKNSKDDQYTIENLYAGDPLDVFNDSTAYSTAGSTYASLLRLEDRAHAVQKSQDTEKMCKNELVACDNLGIIVSSGNLCDWVPTKDTEEQLKMKRKYKLLLLLIKKQQKQIRDTQHEIDILKNQLMIVEGKLQTAIDMNNQFNEIIHN